VTTYLKPEYCWNGTIQKIQEMKDGKTVQIRGIAARAGETSKNGRHYMRGALMRAVNTFFGVPVTVNHAPLTSEQAKQEGLKFDPNMIVGNVTDMVFDEKTDTLNYAADIKKEPYVTLLRQGSPEIRGVSIQADYQRNKCPDCGKEGFEDKGAFESHMAKEHFKHNIKAGPWGIIGRALSLVFGRETPGLSTTVQLAESAIKGFDSLKETVEVEEEKERMSQNKTYGLENKKTVTAPTIKAATPEQKAEFENLIGTPAKIESVTPTQIAPKEPVAKENLKIAEPCSPELKACVDALIADGKEESSAWAICKAKLGEAVTPSKTIVLKEAVAIGKLVFNPKELYVPKGTSPEEYNRIFSETKQQNDSDQIVADTVNEIIDVVSKPMSVTFPEIRIPKDDMSWKETIANLPKDDTSWKEAIANLPKDDTTWKEAIVGLPKDDLTWKETIATLPKDDLSWKEELLKKADAESVNKELMETKALLSKKADSEPLNKELTETKALIVKTTENLAKLEETFTITKKDYEQILNASKTVNAQNKETLEELKKHYAETEAKLKETETKLKVTEEKTAETEKAIKETAVRQDNMEDKLKGQFKGKNKELKHEEPVRGDPMKREN
jgi:hypothetical protein